MAERVLVAVAWPYVNGPPHLGHIAGNVLPADIFARYNRLAGPLPTSYPATINGPAGGQQPAGGLARCRRPSRSVRAQRAFRQSPKDRAAEAKSAFSNDEAAATLC